MQAEPLYVSATNCRLLLAFAWHFHMTPRQLPDSRHTFANLQDVFFQTKQLSVLISKCIYWICKMYLSKSLNVFIKIKKCICLLLAFAWHFHMTSWQLPDSRHTCASLQNGKRFFSLLVSLPVMSFYWYNQSYFMTENLHSKLGRDIFVLPPHPTPLSSNQLSSLFCSLIWAIPLLWWCHLWAAS